MFRIHQKLVVVIVGIQ